MPNLKLFAVLVSVFVLIQSIACSLLKEGNFAIVLTGTGETVLTELDVAAYHTDGTLDLNQRGIENWNSHRSVQDPPKLADSLYNKEFIIKIDGKEVCRGKFWSNVSSASVDGFVILDSLFKLDDNNHSIQIQSTYPGRGPLPDPLGSELAAFFGNHHLLK
jgi:hypothetical protein